jgi:hypothetical protein
LKVKFSLYYVQKLLLWLETKIPFTVWAWTLVVLWL